jgi:hypothetical protein
LHSPYWWLRCVVGPSKDDHPAVAAYHRLLAWDIIKAPKVTRYTERVLNPLIGKSLVLYLHKPVVAQYRPDDTMVSTSSRFDVEPSEFASVAASASGPMTAVEIEAGVGA